MRFLILFFCIFSTLLVSAQADSTAFVIKDGQVYQSNIKETPIGDLGRATRLLVDNVVQQTASFSSDVEIVKGYEQAIRSLLKYVNNFTAQTGVNVWDSLLQKDPILLKREWYLDRRDTLFFRVNSNNVFQYRIGVGGKWNRCYYLINAIVFNGALQSVFFRKGNGFEAFNGSKINQDIRAGSRSVMAPLTPPIIVYENGVVYIEGAYLRWDNKAKKWVDTTPPSVGVKQL
jgi:hypothetical protein